MTEELVARLRGPSTSYLVRYQLRVSISYPQLTGEAWVLPSKSGRERSLIAVAVVGSDFQEALAGGRVVPAKLSSFRVHPGRSRRRTGQSRRANPANSALAPPLSCLSSSFPPTTASNDGEQLRSSGYEHTPLLAQRNSGHPRRGLSRPRLDAPRLHPLSRVHKIGRAHV